MVRWLRSPRVTKVAMVAPALTLFGMFYLVPVGVGLGLSLFRWNGIEPPRYVGFANYERLFDDPVFITNIRVSLIVVGLSLAAVIPLALLLAVCLAGPGWLMSLFRWILFLPVVIPLAAVALLWGEIFNPVGGLANELLGVVGLGPSAWFGDQGTALWALVAAFAWSVVGFHVVIQLSGLSAIPTELKEAGRLETASAWKVFRHVELPLLRETLTVSAVLMVSAAFVFFTSLAFIVTNGGPEHATEVLVLRAYLEAFGPLELGRASAVTVLTMVVAMVLIGITLLVGSRRRVEF